MRCLSLIALAGLAAVCAAAVVAGCGPDQRMIRCVVHEHGYEVSVYVYRQQPERTSDEQETVILTGTCDQARDLMQGHAVAPAAHSSR